SVGRNVPRIKGFAQKDELVAIGHQFVYEKPVIKPDLLPADFLPGNALFYSLFASCLHIAEEVFKVSEVVIADLFVAGGLNHRNEDTAGIFGGAAPVYACDNLTIVVCLERSTEDEMPVFVGS